MIAYTQITIRADIIHDNVRQLRQKLPPLTEIIAIVKADAYGLGAVRMAGILGDKVDTLGVVTASEALALQGKVTLPILVLSEPLPGEDIRALVSDPRISFTVYSPASLRRLSDMATAMDTTVSIHLKANTGMNRLGFSPEDILLFLDKIKQYPGLRLAGLFTHLGFSEYKEHPENELQLAAFETLCSIVRAHGMPSVRTHALSTLGVQTIVGHYYTAVRIGLGLYPHSVTISAPIGYIHDITAGDWVSYAGLYRAEYDHKVAVIYAGYSAGIPSRTTGMSVLIQGERYPVIGCICMDLIMVALPQDSCFEVGDMVVLYGGEGPNAILPEEWAQWAGLNPREIFCRFGVRAKISVG